MHKIELEQNGFSSVNDIYSLIETENIKALISEWNYSNAQTNNASNVFSIRRLIEKIPELKPLLFTSKLKNLISELGFDEPFLAKAIYFDKPENFNWFVSYHQDLSITVDTKHEVDGYSKWTSKHDQLGVIPPKEILENIFTIRVHLDKTDDTNGALRVIPKSHLKGIRRIEEIEEEKSTEVLCSIDEGDVMLMKPLTFHASSKSEMKNRRRVIHLEFSNLELEEPLSWREKEVI
jgi:ectoine hydroxylase-related dioxygenase (phytanoyl-CoA dioxygenase family)